MASTRESRIPSLEALGSDFCDIPVEEALIATFPVRRPLAWRYLPPRSVSGLGLVRAFPLAACPLALGRGRLAARDGRGRIYLVDSLSPSPFLLTVKARRRRAWACPSLSCIARREARLIAAYEDQRTFAAPSASSCSPGPEILASLYYLVVLCGCDAYSLVLDGDFARRGRRPRLDQAGLAASRYSGAGDPCLTSRCRIFRPCPRPAASSSSSRRALS